MRKVLILFVLAGSLYARGIDSVTFEVTQPYFGNEPLTNFLLGNLGLEGKDAATEVFRGTIRNIGSDTVRALYVHVDFFVASQGDGSVYSSRSAPITMLPQETISFSSLNYFNESSGNKVHWDHTFTEDASVTREAELAKLLDAGGRLPSGGATIKLTLASSRAYGSTGNTKNVQYEVVNIDELHLVAPGIPAGAYDISLATIQGGNPQFSWLSDLLSVEYDPGSDIGSAASSTDRFRLEIFELSDMGKLEQTMNSNMPIYFKDMSQSIHTYPTGAAELRAGQLYVWRVRALLKSATLHTYDDTQMISEPFVFRVADPADNQGGGITSDAATVMGILRILLGEDFNYIIKSVEGFDPEKISFNKQALTMEALSDTIHSLTGQGFIIEEIGVSNE